MNLSLEQHLPPAAKVPGKAGGFLSNYATNPSKDNKLRDPLDVRRNTNGPGTKLLLDLDRANAKTPSALRRRLALQGGPHSPEDYYMMSKFEPSNSQALQSIREEKSKIQSKLNPFEKGTTKNLVGGLGGNLLTSRSVEALGKAFLPREEESMQTQVDLIRQEFEDLQAYQTWTKKEIDPMLRDLRKAVLANRPEDVGLYLVEYGYAMCKGLDPPETKLPDELFASVPPENPRPDHSLDRTVRQADLEETRRISANV